MVLDYRRMRKRDDVKQGEIVMRLKKITEKIIIELTAEEAVEFNIMVDRATFKAGIPVDEADKNKCPVCGGMVDKHDNYCAKCGQAVYFVDSDVIPL